MTLFIGLMILVESELDNKQKAQTNNHICY